MNLTYRTPAGEEAEIPLIMEHLPSALPDGTARADALLAQMGIGAVTWASNRANTGVISQNRPEISPAFFQEHIQQLTDVVRWLDLLCLNSGDLLTQRIPLLFVVLSADIPVDVDIS